MTDMDLEGEEKIHEKSYELNEQSIAEWNSAKLLALSEMAGGIAHEINNPLGAISILGQQIQKMMKLDPIQWTAKVIEMTETIAESVKRISGIITSLRVFSRDDSQDPFKETPIKQILENTFNLCKTKFQNQKIEFKIDPIDEMLTIECQPIQISHIIFNLLQNSFDAVKDLPEKWIKISVEAGEKDISLIITDSGPGIPENLRDKIFYPFFTTKAIGQGTGLGLSLSKAIAENHNGTLTVNAKHSHTQFVLFLPKLQSGES